MERMQRRQATIYKIEKITNKKMSNEYKELEVNMQAYGIPMRNAAVGREGCSIIQCSVWEVHAKTSFVGSENNLGLDMNKNFFTCEGCEIFIWVSWRDEETVESLGFMERWRDCAISFTVLFCFFLRPEKKKICQ